YKDNPNVAQYIEKSGSPLSANRRTQKVIVEYSGDKTKISINDDASITISELRQYVDDAPKAEIPDTHYIDGNYPISKYDFDGQKACIRLGKKSEWMSTEYLEPGDREKIKVLAGKAIDAGKSQREDLQVSIKVMNGEIVQAAIMGIGASRPKAKSLAEALQIKRVQTRIEQGTLLSQETKSK
ncbi:MAG: hypothetical protein Q7I92_15465, partial [Humidesulfovibrio sp.]|nr:hypothetical protein [Humidesulfovibrio sp.]